MIKPTQILFVIALSTCCFVGASYGDTIYSDTLYGPNNDVFGCSVTNVTNITVGFIVTIYDDAGKISKGPTTIHLGAKGAKPEP